MEKVEVSETVSGQAQTKIEVISMFTPSVSEEG